jgi:hypothetical protein
MMVMVRMIFLEERSAVIFEIVLAVFSVTVRQTEKVLHIFYFSVFVNVNRILSEKGPCMSVIFVCLCETVVSGTSL